MDIVLINPEIPQNTGSIARTCAATGTALHLVGHLGFDISERAVRRAGLDYWPYVQLTHHQNWEEYLATRLPQAIWLFSKYGTRPYFETRFGLNDALVFGSETKGLGPAFLSSFSQSQILSIPMFCPEVRSLNLSNAVSVVLYEAIRQLWEHMPSPVRFLPAPFPAEEI